MKKTPLKIWTWPFQFLPTSLQWCNFLSIFQNIKVLNEIDFCFYFCFYGIKKLKITNVIYFYNGIIVLSQVICFENCHLFDIYSLDIAMYIKINCLHLCSFLLVWVFYLLMKDWPWNKKKSKFYSRTVHYFQSQNISNKIYITHSDQKLKI